MDWRHFFISGLVHLKPMPVVWWRSWGISRSLKQMVDICLSDRRSLNWRMSRLMSRMSSTCVCYDSISSSQTCSEWSIISLKSVLLQGISHPLLSKFNQLLLDWASVVYPVISLINCSSEQLVVLVDGIESGFELSDVLVFEIKFCSFQVPISVWYLRLDWTDGCQWTNVETISFSVELSSSDISDFLKLCLQIISESLSFSFRVAQIIL